MALAVSTTHQGEAVPAEADNTGALSQLLVGPDDGYGAMSLHRVTLHRGSRWSPDQQPDCDQLIVVLAGQARVSIESLQPVVLASDEVIHVPRAAVHEVDALATDTLGHLELLVLRTPAA